MFLIQNDHRYGSIWSDIEVRANLNIASDADAWTLKSGVI